MYLAPLAAAKFSVATVHPFRFLFCALTTYIPITIWIPDRRYILIPEGGREGGKNVRIFNTEFPYVFIFRRLGVGLYGGPPVASR